MDDILDSFGRMEKEKICINISLKNFGWRTHHSVAENQNVLDVIRKTQNGITYQLFGKIPYRRVS
jgi:flagellar biosynthesis/type III secretory pathway chaperone